MDGLLIQDGVLPKVRGHGRGLLESGPPRYARQGSFRSVCAPATRQIAARGRLCAGAARPRPAVPVVVTVERSTLACRSSARVVGGDDDAVTVARRRHGDPMVPRIAIVVAASGSSFKPLATPRRLPAGGYCVRDSARRGGGRVSLVLCPSGFMQPSLSSSNDRSVPWLRSPIQFAALIELAVRRQAVEVLLPTVRARNIDERLARQPLAVCQKQGDID